MAIPDAASISKEDFDTLVNEYPVLVKEISVTKGSKPGQKKLSQLDVYRYDEAPAAFAINGAKGEMALEDVKRLVEWKLRHGKFRPTLMNLVSSNTDVTATSTIAKAMASYTPSTIPAALTTLTALRGIGPATASLLLSVHDAENVLFFSDEAFWWLCCDGKKDSIKYNPKEYEMLRSVAAKLMKRLGVSAVDVEKAAYVVMKRGGDVAAPPKGKAGPAKAKETTPTVKKPAEKKPPVEKRKPDVADEGSTAVAGTRRSKRVKG
ncbi:hypothetical protein VHEMI04904 [[Torrubiella] hemipterigena]|uniref:Uncharacterized protein n=1 Tax=[Torrubiella] hemipterigena TaxID=1531966 RepID=A0A0A1SWI2_9HYPO|nr:hypothetical protein VHEMI04904 [[Torrubiella] hemipterigena]